MWRFVALGLAVILIAVFGFSLIESGDGDISANAVLTMQEVDTSGFAEAIGPWDWQFPRDHGAHPDFQTEWWYYTGNLATEDGRRFGFQFTIFRYAISPQNVGSESEWRSDQIYMAHFTVTDIRDEQFYHTQRFSRGGAGLAGATVEPRLRVWLEDWQIEALNDDATQVAITAAAEDFTVDLTLEQIKPPVLQGDNGLSQKGDGPGEASYYYSLTRLATGGTLTVEGESFEVSGGVWMDHEFFTGALNENMLGWDWFGLIFDNDYELMVGQIRLAGEERRPAYGGSLVYPDGSVRQLEARDFTIEATDSWESPHTGAVYPAGWVITIAGEELARSDDLRITVTPLVANQELHSSSIAYWEGAVRVEGDMSGYGYTELTGYVDPMTGQF